MPQPRNILTRSLCVVVISSAFLAAGSAMAQRAGDNMRISVGIIEAARPAELKSNTARNSLIGGALGWALARNGSSAEQALGAAAGAAVAGGATSATQDRRAMEYLVRTSSGSAIKVITDQTQMRIGDCVTVEETKQGANLRRNDPSLCKTTEAAVLNEVQDDLEDDAARCDDAKAKLLDAETQEEIDIARQVMDILCNE